MSQPGAKKLDQITSLTPGDVHIIMVPSPGGPVPTPIPHPCTSMIKDDVATTVKVMGQPGAVKGSQSSHTPPHVPMGPGPFQKPPKNKGKIITGSANVFYEGKEAAMLGDTAEMCSDPSDTPVGKVMGTAATVLVGGGGSGSDEAREQASAAAMKAAAAAAHKWIDDHFAPGRAREQAHRDVCTATGHPVDVVTGKVFTRSVDLRLPGRIPLEFGRNYSSARLDRGAFGHGWRHSYECELFVHEAFVAHRDPNGRWLVFSPLAVGDSVVNRAARVTLMRRADGYFVQGSTGLHEFYPGPATPFHGAFLLRPRYVGDAFNNRVVLEYTEGRLSRIRDTAGRTVTLTYDDRGFVTALRLDAAAGLSETLRTYHYSEADDLVAWQDELGHRFRYEYADHHLVRETNRCGFSFFFAYDSEGWCRATWGDEGLLYRRLEYDRQRRRTRVVNSDGLAITYAWNDHGVVEKETDPFGNATHFEYNEALQIVRFEDAEGNVWSSEYDDSGRVMATANPEGAATTTAWSDDGLTMFYTDPTGSQWRREFDALGRTMRCINPAGGVQAVDRDERGDVVRIRHENGRETRCTWTSQGLLESVALPTGLRIVRSYSPRGQLVVEDDQLGARQRMSYDARGNQVSAWERNRGETRFEYDPEGRIGRIVDPKGRSTEYQYGHYNRVVRVRDPAVRLDDGRVQHPERVYEYDLENRLVTSVASGGEATQFVYEGRERPMRIEYADGRCQRYVRDGRGFVLELYENDELVFEQMLDSAGRVLRRVTGDGEEFQYSYDAVGQAVAGEVRGQGGVSLEYDALGRLVAEAGIHGGRSIEYVDPGDRVVRRWNDDLALDCTWSRTEGGLAWHMRRDGRTDLHLEYDARERLTAVGFASGERHELAYSALDRPVRRMATSSAGRDLVEEFAYDEEGWLTSRHVIDGFLQRYARDTANRLVGLTEEGHSGLREFSWGFDAHGNRVRATAPDGTEVDARFVRGNRVVTMGERRLTYDARGRVIAITGGSDGDLHLSWDALGRLREVTRAGGDTVSMRYDAFGRRIEKRGPGGSTRFGWAGRHMVHEIRPDGEERHYLYHHGTHRPLGCYIKQPARDWRLHAYLTDARGAPIRLTDDRQEVVWEQALNPWGEAADGDEPWSQPIALAGQYRDDETGLHYNFARYYLPEAGCYLSADPIGADGGPNAYAYVADPVCWSDPLGLNGDDKCGGKSETYFRTMSREHFEELQRTGRMPGTSETFISPTQSFSEGYDGVTVEFQMKPGTTAALEEIGVRDNSRLTRQQHGDLPPVASGWKEKNAYFKGEGKQVNVGLGTGDALDTFNDNIESFRPVSQQGSGAPVTPSASSTK